MTFDPETRPSLIAKLANPQDEEAWAEFVLIYEPVIRRFLGKYGLQYADAAEVTQEVLAGVVTSIETWDNTLESSTFRGWLYRMTRNKAVDQIRKVARQNEINSKSDSNLSRVAAVNLDSVNSEFFGEFERQLFLWAAEKIRPSVKPVNWQAFWRSTIEGQAVEQVASDLQVDRSQIYVARSRIMKRLVQLVQKRLNESFTGEKAHCD